MEFKDSLLMGKSNFEMRGNLNQKEPLLIKKWADDDIYHKMQEDRDMGEYMLHAYKITFIHPTTKKEMTFTCPLPDYFANIVNHLK